MPAPDYPITRAKNALSRFFTAPSLQENLRGFFLRLFSQGGFS